MSDLMSLIKPTGSKMVKSDALDKIRNTSKPTEVSLRNILSKGNEMSESCSVPVDVLFVHDATSSIEVVINDLVMGLEEVFKIVTQKASLARFGLIAYRGSCGSYGGVVSVKFKSDGNRAFRQLLGRIEHRTSIGWEAPVCDGIFEASQFNWQSRHRVMIVLGDARAPSKCYHNLNLSADKLMRELRVNSHVIYWKTEEMKNDKKWFKELAHMLGGKFFSSSDISSTELAEFILAAILKETGQLADFMKQISSSSQKPAISSKIAGLLTG